MAPGIKLEVKQPRRGRGGQFEVEFVGLQLKIMVFFFGARSHAPNFFPFFLTGVLAAVVG